MDYIKTEYPSMTKDLAKGKDKDKPEKILTTNITKRLYPEFIKNSYRSMRQKTITPMKKD